MDITVTFKDVSPDIAAKLVAVVNKDEPAQALSDAKGDESINTGDYYDSSALLDSDNIPWDQRIHSQSKTMTNEGKWKMRRGVSAIVKKKVTEEIRIDPTSPDVQNTVTITAAPEIPESPMTPGAVDWMPTAPTVDLPTMLDKLAESLTNPTHSLQSIHIPKICEQFDVTNLSGAIADQPDKIAAVYKLFVDDDCEQFNESDDS